MRTGLHISMRKFFLTLLAAITVALFTTFAPIALGEMTDVQVGAPLYACSGHSTGGGDC